VAGYHNAISDTESFNLRRKLAQKWHRGRPSRVGFAPPFEGWEYSLNPQVRKRSQVSKNWVVIVEVVLYNILSASPRARQECIRDLFMEAVLGLIQRVNNDSRYKARPIRYFCLCSRLSKEQCVSILIGVREPQIALPQ